MSAAKTPPNNPDPEKYIVVHSQDGFFLRRKRGTVTAAPVNEAFRLQAENNCSAEAKEIFRALAPFIKQLYGRKQVYLSAKLRRAKLECGVPDYRYLTGHEINEKHELISLYQEFIKIEEKKGTIHLRLPVGEDSMIKKNNAVSDYYFEAILLSGDPRKPGSLRSENDRSALYSYSKVYKTVCNLSLVLPQNKPYLVVLKIGCIEYGKAAHHPMHYGVKILRVGGWEKGGKRKGG